MDPKIMRMVDPKGIFEAVTAGRSELVPYPAPMVLLSTLFVRRTDDAQRYDPVVVPFLDCVIAQHPVLNYPADPPAPPLRDLLKDWSIVVRFGAGSSGSTGVGTRTRPFCWSSKACDS